MGYANDLHIRGGKVPSVASKRGHGTKKKTCSNRVPDMMCFVAKHLKFDSCVKQTVVPDQRVPLISVFHFSQLAGIHSAHLPPESILNI